jgi:hypothetical protein
VARSWRSDVERCVPESRRIAPCPESEKIEIGMAAFLYDFEWDPVKARANFRKHGLGFERAATVFQDPLAVTIPDDEHSLNETRWVTLGKDATDRYVTVVHTFEPLADDRARVRLISPRRPTKAEIRDYEDQQ